MSNIEIQIISLHEIQTLIHLHLNFITYIPQKRIQTNLKLIRINLIN